jgi:NAD(P)-dependent dehydrogenase (short-subunit alcohol dehydrogenase family)
MELAGKSAVVTGGASGIGRAICLALAQRGVRIIVADIDDAAARETVDLVGAAGGLALARHCDVTQTEDLAGAFASCLEHFESFDIACNNAGVSAGVPLFEDDERAWERVVDINLTGVIDATRIAVREMKRRGGGVVVNTASMGGFLPMPGAPVYAATKAAVVNFTRSLAYLAAEANVRVNAIAPSYVDTPLVRQAGDERVRELTELMGGILKPEDVAEGVVELCEDDSRAGAIMRVTLARGRDYAPEVQP